MRFVNSMFFIFKNLLLTFYTIFLVFFCRNLFFDIKISFLGVEKLLQP